MKFFKILAGSAVAKIIVGIVFAFLAVVGFGPDRLVRILISWWTSDPSYFVLNLIRLIFLFLAFITAGFLVWPYIRSRFWPDPIIHVENINLAAGLTPQTTNPVLLIADAKTANKQLRILVEYSSFHRAIGWAGWVKSRQVMLANLSGVVRGQQISVPVVSCNSEGSEVWWGRESDSNGNRIHKPNKCRAQLKFIGSDDSEQTFRFFLLRTTTNEAPFIVEVFTEQDFDTKS
jgi:hypothetical protein